MFINMETILHMLGLCGDNHSHFDLMDCFFMGSASVAIHSIKYQIRGVLLIIKNYFKHDTNN
jgi:hypothetical protein